MVGEKNLSIIAAILTNCVSITKYLTIMNYMKRFKNYLTALALGALAVFTFSCDNNDEIKVDPNAEFDAVLKVKEDSSENANVNFNVTSSTASSILAKVSFQTTSGISMKRLYITTNALGSGDVAFQPTETSIDLKGDGALDLTNKDDEKFEYQFELPVPDSLKSQNGTLVYSFWTTTGNGDFRDPSKRLAIGPATITLKFGTAVDPDAGSYAVKSYPSVKLLAPTADGTSKTFVSLVDGNTYNVSQGIEAVALWDFGYLYSNTDHATLRAPYNYNVPYYPGVLANPIVDIPAKSGTTNDDLNKTYFKLSAKTAADFDAVETASDLDFVTVTASDDNIRITNLDVDDVVEFIDNYGKKGLIKVLAVDPGNQQGKSITIAIKVQP